MLHAIYGTKGIKKLKRIQFNGSYFCKAMYRT